MRVGALHLVYYSSSWLLRLAWLIKSGGTVILNDLCGKTLAVLTIDLFHTITPVLKAIQERLGSS
jgi:hypothetical protein